MRSLSTTTSYAGQQLPVRSIDDVLSDFPMTRFHYGLCVMCGLVFMADALEVSLLSFLGDCVAETWNLSNTQIAALTTCVFSGQLLGSSFWGPFADRFGRRKAYLSAGSIIVVSSWASAVAPNYTTLLVLRGICGIGIGGSTVPFDLTAEFLPPSERGANLMLLELFWTLGSMMVIGSAWLFLEQYGWRTLIYTISVPMTMVLAVAFWLLPESPRWLISQGRYAEAEAMVRDMAKTSKMEIAPFCFTSESNGGPRVTKSSHDAQTTNPIGSAAAAAAAAAGSAAGAGSSEGGKFGGMGSTPSTHALMGDEDGGSSPSSDKSSGSGGGGGEDTIPEVAAGGRTKSLAEHMVPGGGGGGGGGGGTWYEFVWGPYEELVANMQLLLATPDERRSFQLLAVIWGSFGFTYYGLILLVTRLYKMADEAGGDDASSEDGSNATCSFDYGDILINSTGEIPGVIAAYLLVDWAGRRATQTSTYVLGGICLVVLGSLYNTNLTHGSILSLSLIARACAMASSCLTWVVTPELFRTETRATAHSVLNCLARICAGLSPLFVVSDLPFLPVAIVLGCINCTAAAAAFQLRETSGTKMDGDSGDQQNTSVRI
jgi:MFS family permease